MRPFVCSTILFVVAVVTVTISATGCQVEAHSLNARPSNVSVGECRGSGGIGRSPKDGVDGYAGAPGIVVARAQVDVAFEVGGRLETLDLNVGDHVAKGQVLARLDVTAVEADLRRQSAILVSARRRMAHAAIAAEESSVDARRTEALFNEHYVAQAQVEGARFRKRSDRAKTQETQADVHATTAQREVLEAELRQSDAVAPFSGTVSARYAQPGDQVAGAQPLMRLISDGARRVRFAVHPELADRFSPGSLVEVKAHEYRLRGTVLWVSPELDGPSQSFFAEAELEEQPLTLAIGQPVHVFGAEGTPTP